MVSLCLRLVSLCLTPVARARLHTLAIMIVSTAALGQRQSVLPRTRLKPTGVSLTIAMGSWCWGRRWEELALVPAVPERVTSPQR